MGDLAALTQDGDLAALRQDGDLAALTQDGDLAALTQDGDLATPTQDGDLVTLRLLLDRFPNEQRLGTNLFLLVMGVASWEGESPLNAMFVVRDAS